MTESAKRTVAWAEMRRSEIKRASEADFVVIVPLGATEQHGEHLPVDTDTNQAWEVAQRVAESIEGVLVAPSVPWGVSYEHMRFPGTISLQINTFIRLVSEICDSLIYAGFRKILLLNSHGGDTVKMVVDDVMIRHGIPITSAAFWDFAADEMQTIRKSGPGGIAHSGEMETSIQLYLRPELVDMQDAEAHYIDEDSSFGIPRGLMDMFDFGTVYVGRDRNLTHPTGVMGDPSVASAATGDEMMKAVVRRIVEFLESYKAIDIPDPPHALWSQQLNRGSPSMSNFSDSD